MTNAQWGELPAPVVVRAPAWMRWFGVPLLLATWGAMASPIVLAVRERDWMAPVRDSGLGAVGAVLGWVLVAFFIVVIPPCIKVLLSYRTVLDVDGVDAPFGRGRFDLAQIDKVRWVPQGGPVNAANRPERFEVLAEQAGLVARVTRSEAHWSSAQALFRHWASVRPEIVHDDPTAAALADESIEA